MRGAVSLCERSAVRQHLRCNQNRLSFFPRVGAGAPTPGLQIRERLRRIPLGSNVYSCSSRVLFFIGPAADSSLIV